MWIFGSPKNYTEMVEKISKSTFILSVFLLYILYCANEQFADALDRLSFGIQYKFVGIEFCLAGLCLPLLIGILEHIFKIHDKISTLLKIRYKYDKNIIINAIAQKCGLSLDIDNISKEKCDKLMGKIFYKYASSTKPEIDNHSILLALNEWCWFWIVMDTTILFLLTGIIFLFINFSCYNLLTVISIFLVLSFILWLIKQQAKEYTKQEINAILSDFKRKKTVKKVLENALRNR